MQFFFYAPKLCEKFIANTELLPLQQHDNGALQPVSPDGEISTPVNSEDKQVIRRRYPEVSWNAQNNCENTVEYWERTQPFYSALEPWSPRDRSSWFNF